MNRGSSAPRSTPVFPQLLEQTQMPDEDAALDDWEWRMLAEGLHERREKCLE